MSHNISIGNQTIGALVYTKDVVSYDVINIPDKSMFGISYGLNFTTGGMTRGEKLTFGLVWNADAGLTYDEMNELYIGSGEEAVISKLVLSADAKSFFD